MVAFLALLLRLALALPEAAGKCACPPGRGAQTLGEKTICGRHEDIWGFVVNVPRGSCGDPYLHGVLLTLPGARDSSKRSIAVFAANNVMLYKSIRELALEAQQANDHGASTVLQRGPVIVAGIRGERWRVLANARNEKVLREDIYILRRVNVGQNEPPDYIYTFTLVTTPAFYERDHKVFVAVLRSVAFTAPER